MTPLRTLRMLAVWVAAVAALVAAASAGAPKRGAAAAGPESSVGGPDESGLFRHTGAYPALSVGWRPDGRVRGVVGVFPHPALPERAVVTAAGGVFLSDDSGGTWTALAQAVPDRVGVIRSVAFDPEAPDTFYLASDHRGVWATTDGGKTVVQAGTKQAGMASDDTLAVYVYPGDRRFRTLLAIHGGAAAGVSVTLDGGRTWRVAARDYVVREILCGGAGDEELMLVAAKKEAPDVLSVYYSVSLDDYWVEVVRDLVPTGGAASVLVKPERWTEEVFRGAQPYYATADAGLYRVSQGGASRVGPPNVAYFASIGVTWGPTADSQVLYAYEPRKLGLMVSTDNLQTVSTASAGLYTGAFVKEGAHVRAGANGAVFYGAINEALFVGRREGGPAAVTRATVRPAVLVFQPEAQKDAMEGLREELRTFPETRSAARDVQRVLAKVRDAQAYLSETRFTVTAKAAAPGSAPASVSVDLSRVGGPGLTPMADDGRHGDGAAGDGVYGAMFRLDPRRFRSDSKDWRRRWPGRIGLTVTALGADGAIASEVAVLSVFDRRESFLVARRVDPIVAKGEPWKCSLGPGDKDPREITDYYALGFWIMTDIKADDEVFVQVRDGPPYSLPITTPPVPVVKENLVEGGKVTGEWRRVVIPLARLLKDAPGLRTGRWANVILSGEGKTPGTYWVEDMRFLIRPEDAQAPRGAKSR